MRNLKSLYLRYEVAGDQFFIRAVSGLNLMTSDSFYIDIILKQRMNQVQIRKCIYEKLLRKAIMF